MWRNTTFKLQAYLNYFGFCKIKIFNQLQISGKIGFTFYDDKHTIGSGLETIENNWHGDGKLQIIWSF